MRLLKICILITQRTGKETGSERDSAHLPEWNFGSQDITTRFGFGRQVGKTAAYYVIYLFIYLFCPIPLFVALYDGSDI